MARQGQSAVEIYPVDRKGKKWAYRVRASNGRIILDMAENPQSKFNAERSALSLIQSVATAYIEVVPE